MNEPNEEGLAFREFNLLHLTTEEEFAFRDRASRSGEVICAYPHARLVMDVPCPMCGGAL